MTEIQARTLQTFFSRNGESHIVYFLCVCVRERVRVIDKDNRTKDVDSRTSMRRLCKRVARQVEKVTGE